MISKELIDQNKQKLLQEQERLGTLLSRVTSQDKKTGDFTATFPEFGNKEDENASEVAAYEANVAEERDLELKLRKVKAALERIEAGTYGICLVGGEEVPTKRLLAVPEAENCVTHDSSQKV